LSTRHVLGGSFTIKLNANDPNPESLPINTFEDLELVPLDINDLKINVCDILLSLNV